MLSLQLLSIPLLFLLPSLTTAGPTPPGMNLFYSYSLFCTSPPSSTPYPPNSVHQCFDSSSGPVTQQLPTQGTYSVFPNKDNDSQFAVVVWDDTTRAQVVTRDGDTITVWAGYQAGHPGCPDVLVAGKDGITKVDYISCPKDGPIKI